MKKCLWHRWDVAKDMRTVGSFGNWGHIIKTTKTCRICGEVRVKERVEK